MIRLRLFFSAQDILEERGVVTLDDRDISEGYLYLSNVESS